MNTPSLLRSSAVMAAGTATSRLLGFVRAVVTVMAIGLNFPAANAFDVANKVPNILYMLVAGGVLNAVLVPQIVRATRREDGGKDFLDRLLTLTVGLMLLVTLVVTVAAPLLTRLYSADSWPPEQIALATGFAFLCLPQVFFYGLYTVLGQVLNARGSFGPYMWAPVASNVIGIAGLVVFIVLFGQGSGGQHTLDSWTPDMVLVLAGSATLGVVAQALVLLPTLRRIGFTYHPRYGFRGVGLGTARRVAMWTFAAVAVGQVVFVTTSKVAAAANGRAVQSGSELLVAATPSNAAYSNAYLLFMLPHSLVAVSLVTALFTRMSHAAGAGDLDEVRNDLSLGLRIVGMVSVLGTAGLVALQEPIGRAIVNGSTVAGQALGQVAAAMALGLLPFSANYLFQRVFYAFEDARTPFIAQLPTFVVVALGNLLCLWLLPIRYIVVGVGVVMSVGNVVGAAFAAVLLRRRLGRLDGYVVVRTHVRLTIAGLLAGLAGWAVTLPLLDLTRSGQLGGAVTLVVAGSVLTGLYLALLKTMRVRELDDVLVPVLRRLRRS
ncbi:MAG: murein biosynthesis integral membrane protein MurJ [Actinomycetes bacterium]